VDSIEFQTLIIRFSKKRALVQHLHFTARFKYPLYVYRSKCELLQTSVNNVT